MSAATAITRPTHRLQQRTKTSIQKQRRSSTQPLFLFLMVFDEKPCPCGCMKTKRKTLMRNAELSIAFSLPELFLEASIAATNTERGKDVANKGVVPDKVDTAFQWLST